MELHAVVEWVVLEDLFKAFEHCTGALVGEKSIERDAGFMRMPAECEAAQRRALILYASQQSHEVWAGLSESASCFGGDIVAHWLALARRVSSRQLVNERVLVHGRRGRRERRAQGEGRTIGMAAVGE